MSTKILTRLRRHATTSVPTARRHRRDGLVEDLGSNGLRIIVAAMVSFYVVQAFAG